MHCWCSEFRRMRVFLCASTNELPDSIGHWKHLRYLKISRDCPFKSIPSAFCCLYNLQILDAKKLKLESLPNDFGKLLNLQVLELPGFLYRSKDEPLSLDAANEQGAEFRLLKNMNQICGDSNIYGLGAISTNHAAETELKNKKYLDRLKLSWSERNPEHNPEHNAKEVLQVLQPPTSLKSLELSGYPCESLPSWFQPQNLPSITSLSDISQRIDNNDGSIGIFPSLTDLTINGCQKLSSLEQFIQHVPAIKRIRTQYCKSLVSLATAMHCLDELEELDVIECPNFSSQSLLSPSLKRLSVGQGYFSTNYTYEPPTNVLDNIDCPSLTYLHLSSPRLTSIQLQMWTLPALQELKIVQCGSLTFIGESESRHGGGSSLETLSSLTKLSIVGCNKLSTLDDLLRLEYIPAIEKICVNCCAELQSLPGERFGSFPFLKVLEIRDSPNLDWRSGLVLPSSLESLTLVHCGDISGCFPSGLVLPSSLESLSLAHCGDFSGCFPSGLPSSLQSLSLAHCGDISACFPSCLESLTSLVSLQMDSCAGVASIPRCNIASLWVLCLRNCPDLVSIGGAKAIAKIKDVCIEGCPKLKQPKQPVCRGSRVHRWY